MHVGKLGGNRSVDLTNGPIFKKLIFFTFPIIFSGILQVLFNAADTIIVGNWRGDNALAAVSSNGHVINLFINMFMGLSVGANVIVAKYFGAKKFKDLSEAIHTSIALSIVSGVFLSIIGIVLAPYILRLISVPESILDLSVLYLRIYFIGMPASMIYNFGTAILRAIGDTKRPLYFLAISGALNVVLNIIFVALFGMSVDGVALASVLSLVLSAVLVIVSLVRNTECKLEFKKIKFHKQKIIDIIKIGIPSGLNGMVFSVSNIILQGSINSFNDDFIIAGNGAASSIENFVYVIMNGFSQAVISFVGQNVGARNYNRVKKVTIYALISGIVCGIIIGNLVALFGRNITSLFSKTPEVIDASMIKMNIVSRLYFLCSMVEIFVGAQRGMGNSLTPTLISIFAICGTRLIWIFTIFNVAKYHTLGVLFTCYPLSWAICSIGQIIAFIILFKKNKKKCEQGIE